MRYFIPVNRLDNLKKKLNRINKKNPGIIQYGEIGEVVLKQSLKEEFFNGKYTELADAGVVHIKCMEVEVEGTYKLNDWQFAATLQHTENGNIIRNISNKELPLRFRDAECKCEHCNRIRNRKDTYIVYNSKSDEYKQVGKSCLKDYTGLDSEVIASAMSFISEVILKEEYETLEIDFGSGCYSFDTSYIQAIAYYYVSKFGYNKQSESNSTVKGMISELTSTDSKIGDVGKYQKSIQSILDDITKYAKSLEGVSEFIYNCKIAWLNEYTEYRNFVFIAFFVKMYIEYQAKNKNVNNSKFVGNINDKIIIDIKSYRVLYTKSPYSYYAQDSYVYEIIDNDGNVYIWSTASYLENVKKIKATVKEHNEYKGVKQTVITRGKIINEPKEEIKIENVSGEQSSVDKALEEFLNYVNS